MCRRTIPVLRFEDCVYVLMVVKGKWRTGLCFIFKETAWWYVMWL